MAVQVEPLLGRLGQRFQVLAPLPLRLSGLPVLGDLLFATVMRPSSANTRRQFDQFVVHTD